MEYYNRKRKRENISQWQAFGHLKRKSDFPNGNGDLSNRNAKPAVVPLINLADDEDQTPASKIDIMGTAKSQRTVIKPFTPSARPSTSSSGNRHHSAATSNGATVITAPNPYQAFTSNKFEPMDSAIMKYHMDSRLDPVQQNHKIHAFNSLSSIITSHFPGSRLHLVGSSVTGFGTKDSDMDLCLMIRDGEVPWRECTKTLEKIQHILLTTPGMINVNLIRATVPIIEFNHSFSRQECDMNINNTVGIRNSHLLQSYCQYDNRVGPLVLFVKKWAKFQNINSAKHKTISSYVLTLMTIHYLQYGVASKPVLPCLQREFPHLFHDRIAMLNMGIKFPEIPPSQRNDMSLGELFLGFLKYYVKQFNFDRNVVSVRVGHVLHIREVLKREQCAPQINKSFHERKSTWMSAQLFVEEPFNLTNAARSVYDPNVFCRIYRVFKRSYEKLQQTLNIDDIITHPF